MGSWAETLKTTYLGEVLGEDRFRHMPMADCGHDNPAAACLPQLEAEAKAHLRPHVIAAGLSAAEPTEICETGVNEIDPSPKRPIVAQLGLRRDVVTDFIPQFEGRLADARRRGVSTGIELCEFTRSHEKVQREYAGGALGGGDRGRILEPLQSFLKTPLPHGCDAEQARRRNGGAEPTRLVEKFIGGWIS